MICACNNQSTQGIWYVYLQIRKKCEMEEQSGDNKES